MGHASTAGHEQSRGKRGGPPSKAKYTKQPIANEYREGPVKSTPLRGVKQNLKPGAARLSEPGATPVMACLLENEPASERPWPAKGVTPGAGAKASLKRARWSRAIDPKPGELSMARLKRG